MGVAAYNRGNAAISRQFQAELDTSRATLDNRARLWKRAMEMGGILQFRVAGEIVTCGPYQTATGAPGYFAIRYGRSRFAGEFQGRSAWGVALWVLEHVGRSRPFKAEF